MVPIPLHKSDAVPSLALQAGVSTDCRQGFPHGEKCGLLAGCMYSDQRIKPIVSETWDEKEAQRNDQNRGKAAVC